MHGLADDRCLRAAISYAEQFGWRTFPTHAPKVGGCSCGRVDCGSPGKHPVTQKGFLDAATDAGKLRTLWKKEPAANVAIATGRISGVVVLDVDPRNGGDETLEDLLEKHGPLPDTVSALTGGGGAHYFFAYPADASRIKSRAIGRGLDCKADGGYVVAAPSMHASGKAYTWEASSRPGEVPLAPLPDWLAALVVERAAVEAQAPSGEAALSIVGQAFAAAGFWIRDLGGGKAAVRCPWDAEHTSGRAGDGSTVVFGARPGSGMGWFHCSHSHCAGRGVADALGALRALGADVSEDVERAAIVAEGAERSVRGVTDPCTDLGNAERLIVWHGGGLRHVTSWGKWAAWDGARWSVDGAEPIVSQLATSTARRMLADAIEAKLVATAALASATAAGSVDDRTKNAAKQADRVVGWAVKSQGAGRIQAMVSLAKSARGTAIEHGALDADPWLLNVTNGTIDLQTGSLREHRREDLVTKIAPVAFDPTAKAPTWDAFLRRAMDGDDELIAFLRRFVGYSLTGVIREHALLFCYGSGANGKSTFLGTVQALIGDYARSAPRGLLFASKLQQHPTELASLFGARFVTCSEIEEGRAFDESKVKDLTGGDRISARRMNEDFWDFAPSHKLAIGGNHKPTVRGTDEGIWRRLRLVPWTVQIPTAERDPELLEKLRAELPGILAWAVRGCLEWRRAGLGEPPAVRSATDAYREESDPLGEFFGLRCVFDGEARVSRKMLRHAYDDWCGENGIRQPLDAKRFAAALRLRGVGEVSVRHEGRTVDGWKGVRLTTDADREARSAWGRRDLVGTNSRSLASVNSSRVVCGVDLPPTTSLRPYGGVGGATGSAAE